MEFVSYSHTTEDGQFMESYGYNVHNSAEDFFNNLSIEELDKIREPNLKEFVSKGEVIRALEYISYLIKEESQIKLDKYESELRRQVSRITFVSFP